MKAIRYDYIFENNPNTWILNNGSSDNMKNEGKMFDKSTMFGLLFPWRLFL